MSSTLSGETKLASEASYSSYGQRPIHKEVDIARRVLIPLYRSIKRQGGLKNTAIIAIVQQESMDDLEQAFKRPRWKFWKGATRISVSCSRGLQETLNDVQIDRRIHRIIMVASDEVCEMTFNVGSKISTLLVRRFNYKRRSEDMLMIDGSATFNNVHLDSWSARRHRRHKLYLGENVGIKVRPDQIPSWAGSTDRMSGPERDRIWEYLRSMGETRMEGSWWEQWKGYIAGILAVAVAGTKLTAGMSATARGFFVNFKFLGISAGAGEFGVSAFTSAAGPAILLGCATGAAVYFIPWTDIFSWLESVVRSFTTWLKELGEKVCNLLSGRQTTNRFDGGHGSQSFPAMA